MDTRICMIQHAVPNQAPPALSSTKTNSQVSQHHSHAIRHKKTRRLCEKCVESGVKIFMVSTRIACVFSDFLVDGSDEQTAFIKCVRAQRCYNPSKQAESETSLILPWRSVNKELLRTHDEFTSMKLHVLFLPLQTIWIKRKTRLSVH